jgi:hypothetical protein
MDMIIKFNSVTDKSLLCKLIAITFVQIIIICILNLMNIV